MAGGSLIAIELIVNWSPVLEVDQPGIVAAGQRYSAAPCLFLLTAMAAGLDALPDRGYLPAAVRLAVPAIIGIAIVGELLLGAGQLTGPSWRQAVNDAAQQCADRRQATDSRDPARPARLVLRAALFPAGRDPLSFLRQKQDHNQRLR